MKKLILVVSTLLLGACDVEQRHSDKSVDVSVYGTTGSVVEVTLKDGTRCAVLVGSYKGGITCDWTSGTRAEEPKK